MDTKTKLDHAMLVARFGEGRFQDGLTVGINRLNMIKKHIMDGAPHQDIEELVLNAIEYMQKLKAT